jgi:hypothetical protein
MIPISSLKRTSSLLFGTLLVQQILAFALSFLLLPLSAAIVLYDCHFALGANNAAILRGIVTIEEPVDSGRIFLYNRNVLLQDSGLKRFHNGAFSLPLNPAVTDLLGRADLRIEVEIGSANGKPASFQSARLMADLHRFDPAAQVVIVNPVTSIVAGYRVSFPNASAEEANAFIASATNLPTAAPAACQAPRARGVDNVALMTASNRFDGFPGLAQAVAWQAPQSAPRATSSSPDYPALFLALAQDIADGALEVLPYGNFAGWILSEVLSAPGQTQAEKDVIAPQLEAIVGQLDDVLAGIGSLSEQISAAESKIIQNQNFIAYQQQAQDVQKDINAVCDLYTELLFLGKLDLNEDNTDLAKSLQDRILTTVRSHLLNIWSALEGANSVAIPGLINRWADLIAQGLLNKDINLNKSTALGFPTFVDNRYLKPATAHFEYYLAAELIGMELQIEYWHSVAKAKPTTAKAYIEKAMHEFDDHYDLQKRRVARDIPLGGPVRGNGKKLFAAQVLPSDDWIIDTRSGLMWSNKPACLNGQKPPACLFFMYPKADNSSFGEGAEWVGSWIDKFRKETELPDIAHWGSFLPGPPSKSQMLDLIAGWKTKKDPQGRLNGTPRWFLRGIGIDIPATQPTWSYWTSDVAKSGAAASKYYPQWANWVVDITNGVPWWEQGGPGGAPQPIALYLPVGAPTIRSTTTGDPAMVYQEGQDAISPPAP